MIENKLEKVIYKTTNLINGKIYIGQYRRTHRHFGNSYLGSGNLLILAIKKYGKENLKKEIIEYCYSKEDANEREKYWINKLNSRNRDIGYNIAMGGDGTLGVTSWSKGRTNVFSKETIEKLIKSHTGHIVLEKTKKKISIATRGENNPFYGKKHSPETKRRISEVKKSQNLGGENHPMYGKHHTKESRRKISEAGRKRVTTDETRRKISESSKGRIVSEKTRKKISKSLKGRVLSEEWKMKLSLAIKGRKLSSETKNKITKYIYSAVSPAKIIHNDISDFRCFCIKCNLNYNSVLCYIKKHDGKYKNWVFLRRLK